MFSGINKVQLTLQQHALAVRRHAAGTNGPEHVAQLLQAGAYPPVGEHQAVHAKIAVAENLAEIPSVQVLGFTGGRAAVYTAWSHHSQTKAPKISGCRWKQRS